MKSIFCIMDFMLWKNLEICTLLIGVNVILILIGSQYSMSTPKLKKS